VERRGERTAKGRKRARARSRRSRPARTGPLRAAGRRHPLTWAGFTGPPAISPAVAAAQRQRTRWACRARPAAPRSSRRQRPAEQVSPGTTARSSMTAPAPRSFALVCRPSRSRRAAPRTLHVVLGELRIPDHQLHRFALVIAEDGAARSPRTLDQVRQDAPEGHGRRLYPHGPSGTSDLCSRRSLPVGQARGGGPGRHLRRPVPGAVRVHAARILGGQGAAAHVSLDTETTPALASASSRPRAPSASAAGVDADKVVKLLKKYEKDDEVKAIVLRVDSPGGSVAPSQEIHDAVSGSRRRRRWWSRWARWPRPAATTSPLPPTGSTPSRDAHRIHRVIFVHFNVRGLLEWAKIEETTLRPGSTRTRSRPSVLSATRTARRSRASPTTSTASSWKRWRRPRHARGAGARAGGRAHLHGQAGEGTEAGGRAGGFDDAIGAAWALAGQSGEPKCNILPGSTSCRCATCCAAPSRAPSRARRRRAIGRPRGGVMFLAPNLVR